MRVFDLRVRASLPDACDATELDVAGDVAARIQGGGRPNYSLRYDVDRCEAREVPELDADVEEAVALALAGVGRPGDSGRISRALLRLDERLRGGGPLPARWEKKR